MGVALRCLLVIAVLGISVLVAVVGCRSVPEQYEPDLGMTDPERVETADSAAETVLPKLRLHRGVA